MSRAARGTGFVRCLHVSRVCAGSLQASETQDRSAHGRPILSAADASAVSVSIVCSTGRLPTSTLSAVGPRRQDETFCFVQPRHKGPRQQGSEVLSGTVHRPDRRGHARERGRTRTTTSGPSSGEGVQSLQGPQRVAQSATSPLRKPCLRKDQCRSRGLTYGRVPRTERGHPK